LLFAGIYKSITGDHFFDAAFFGGNGTANLELITYHTLALGFIASTFKASKGKLTKQRTEEILNTGITTVATYLLQGILGLGITIVAAKVIAGFFPAAGVLLPFGYGQGTGQAMNYGNIYEMDFGFEGGKSFGLTVAALGFLSASLGGVVHLIYLRRKKKITGRSVKDEVLSLQQIQSANEIPMQGSMDKLTVQLAFVAGAYFLAYLLMFLLGNLLPNMKSVIYGFNFLLGVLSATLVKAVVNGLQKKSIIKKQYVSDFLMTRCSNFFFDVMVVAGIAAIRLDMLEKYWGILLILGVVGLVLTYIYNYFVAKTLFKAYAQEQFLTMYGMLTGTASTGIILLRELDGNFETPAADNMVYQNFPAIVLGFPMMFLATLAPKKPIFTLIVFVVFFLVLNLLLFRSVIFRKKKK
jgi:ESS family glutamate:Na+ symporter